ncbi:hypothetical protein [Halalkaliarchaeum sp. AArc-CO]|uniref:hypothetical protein n=1 Tax=Halalkaliarchaeum sp. AArc-CO TaxID=2866381 RepID=UPI00217D5F77|nr:hypothetical protein [Halalkaliarchaeum sp. AArc-CO]
MATVEGGRAAETVRTHEADQHTGTADAFLMVNHLNHALQEQRGWDDADRTRAIRAVLQLDPDLLNELDLTGWHGPDSRGYAARHREIRSVANTYDLPFSLGVHAYINTDQLHPDWYEQLPEDERWEYPDGSTVWHPNALAAESFDRQPRMPHGEDQETINPSSFAEGTRDRLIRTGAEILAWGATEFWIDSPVQGIHSGLDFSEWAQTAFREHLTALPDHRRSELGIDDPASFDVLDYFEAAGVTPAETSTPAADPVFREYAMFQHTEQREFVDDVFSEAVARAPARDTGYTVFGLGFGLQWNHLSPASIYKSDHVDVISIETQPTVPPERPHDMSMKIGRAAGRFEKPVRAWGRMFENFTTTAGLETSDQYPTLMQFHVAQAYSNGVRRSLPMTGLPNSHADRAVNSWMQPDGTIPDELHQCADFLRAMEPYLTDVTEASETVVAVSLPTLLWQRTPEWGTYRADHSVALGEVANVLRNQHVPYDVVILDMPDLWEAPEQTERLQSYDRLVLPGVECVSDRHAEAITAALDTGTTVIATGTPPVRSEEYQPRDDLRAHLDEADRATVLDTEPNQHGTGESADRFREALDDDSPHVSIETDTDVGVSVFTNAGTTIVHLVNYEYDRETDEMDRLDDLAVSLSEAADEATYYTPQGVTDLSVEPTDDGISLQVPTVRVWGILVLDERAPETTEETVREQIEEIRTVIEATDTDREPLAVRAGAKLDKAERVLQYNALEVAQSLATEAEDLIEGVAETQTPTATPTEDDPTPTETTEPTEQSPTKTDETVPGFGIPATLLSAGALYALLESRQTEE